MTDEDLEGPRARSPREGRADVLLLGMAPAGGPATGLAGAEALPTCSHQMLELGVLGSILQMRKQRLRGVKGH